MLGYKVFKTGWEGSEAAFVKDCSDTFKTVQSDSVFTISGSIDTSLRLPTGGIGPHMRGEVGIVTSYKLAAASSELRLLIPLIGPVVL